MGYVVATLQPLGKEAEGKHLHTADRPRPGIAVGDDSSKGWHLCDPAGAFFALGLDSRICRFRGGGQP